MKLWLLFKLRDEIVAETCSTWKQTWAEKKDIYIDDSSKLWNVIACFQPAAAARSSLCYVDDSQCAAALLNEC